MSDLPQYAHDAAESIDASFFSGDTFHSKERVAAIKFYVERWACEIAVIEKMLCEDEEHAKK